jgi:hypothetical protein
MGRKEGYRHLIGQGFHCNYQFAFGLGSLFVKVGLGLIDHTVSAAARGLNLALPLAQGFAAGFFPMAIDFLAGSLDVPFMLLQLGIRLISLLPGVSKSTECGLRAGIQSAGKWLEKQPIEKGHQEKDKDYRRNRLDKQLPKLARYFTHKCQSYRLEFL